MYVPSPESQRGRLDRRRRTWPAISTGITCRARSTSAITASATTRDCSRRSRRWPRRCSACWPVSGCSRAGVAGSRPSAWHWAGWPAWAWESCGHDDFPIIKILWTSTYVLVAGGWSLLLLALFYTIIDVIGLRAWAFFFVVIGVNAITIYVASRIIPFPEISQFFLGGAARLSGSFGPVLSGDRNPGDRMAAVAPSLPEPNFLAGLS